MAQKLLANANPEKRLFISLLTRDISLIAAILDLIDNSVNAAVEPSASLLQSAADYLTIFKDEAITPMVDIRIKIGGAKVELQDTAHGISATTAKEQVFRFGSPGAGASDGMDRLSVYGIGLKRAIFKIGNQIEMRSDHIDGGFDMSLDVADWATKPDLPWQIPISSRQSVPKGKTGTKIIVSELSEDSRRRLADGVFEGQLRQAISRTYAFYLAKFVNIFVNGQQIEAATSEIGSNYASETFSFGDTTCAITAGIGTPQGGTFRDKAAGWFIFCNGRAVISADKSSLTGWGTELPIFQPKHRPFVGVVFFVAVDPEQLPWTTTKSGINEDSATWQEAKRHMAAVGRSVISYLDSRYGDEGTEIASEDVEKAAGDQVNVISAAVATKKSFKPPTQPQHPTTTRIQYDAKVADIKRIATYLRRPAIGGAEVGRYTFNYFLRNEVGTK